MSTSNATVYVDLTSTTPAAFKYYTSAGASTSYSFPTTTLSEGSTQTFTFQSITKPTHSFTFNSPTYSSSANTGVTVSAGYISIKNNSTDPTSTDSRTFTFNVSVTSGGKIYTADPQITLQGSGG